MDVGPNLAKQIPVSSKPFKEYLDKSISESNFITPVTEDAIERDLTNINPHKSYRFDNLHPKVVRVSCKVVRTYYVKLLDG